jgi:Flp pilus assembly pilin Flp
MTAHWQRLRGDTRGGGLVEYIILIGVVALICIAAYQVFGETIGLKARQQAETIRTLKGTSPGGGPAPDRNLDPPSVGANPPSVGGDNPSRPADPPPSPGASPPVKRRIATP